MDFVAATQDGSPPTPLIIPSSPTGPENEHGNDSLTTAFCSDGGSAGERSLNLFSPVRCGRADGYVTAAGRPGAGKGGADGHGGRF